MNLTERELILTALNRLGDMVDFGSSTTAEAIDGVIDLLAQARALVAPKPEPAEQPAPEPVQGPDYWRTLVGRRVRVEFKDGDAIEGKLAEWPGMGFSAGKSNVAIPSGTAVTPLDGGAA